MPTKLKIKSPKKFGPTNPPSKAKKTLGPKSKRTKKETVLKNPNTPGEKQRQLKGGLLMGSIRNKKTFAGETGLEGLKKKINYNRRGKKLGGPAGSQLGDLNKDGKISGYEKKRQTAIEKAMAKQNKKSGPTQKSTKRGGTQGNQFRRGGRVR